MASDTPWVPDGDSQDDVFQKVYVGRIVTLEEGILFLVGEPFERHRLGLHRRGTYMYKTLRIT